MRRGQFIQVLVSAGMSYDEAEYEWDMASTDPDNFKLNPPDDDEDWEPNYDYL